MLCEISCLRLQLITALVLTAAALPTELDHCGQIGFQPTRSAKNSGEDCSPAACRQSAYEQNDTAAECTYSIVDVAKNSAGDPLEATTFQAAPSQSESSWVSLDLDLGRIRPGDLVTVAKATYSHTNIDGDCKSFKICPPSGRLLKQNRHQQVRMKLRLANIKLSTFAILASKFHRNGNDTCLGRTHLRLLAIPGHRRSGLQRQSNCSVQIGFQDPGCLNAGGGLCNATVGVRDCGRSRLSLWLLNPGVVKKKEIPSHPGWAIENLAVKISPAVLTDILKVTLNGQTLTWKAYKNNYRQSYNLLKLVRFARSNTCPRRDKITRSVLAPDRPTDPNKLDESLQLLLGLLLLLPLSIVLLCLLHRLLTPQPPPSSVLLIAASGEVLRHASTVQLLRCLHGQCRLRVLKAGLSQLQPGMTRSCQLLLLVSRDPDFSDFRLAECCSELVRCELLTVLQTERHRTRRLHLGDSGCDIQQPTDLPPAAAETLVRLDGSVETVAKQMLENLQLPLRSGCWRTQRHCAIDV